MTTQSYGQAKKHLAEQVKKSIADQFGEQNLKLKQIWVDVFWSQLPLDDWRHKEISDVAGCCESLWMLLNSPGELPLVQVINPSIEEHGWVSGGTVIMIRQMDMPFLVDSVRLELNRRAIHIHTIKSTLVYLQRDEQGNVVQLQQPDPDSEPKTGWKQEAVMFVEVGLLADAAELKELKEAILDVLGNVTLVVDDYAEFLSHTQSLRQSLVSLSNNAEMEEAVEFLSWLEDSHFTFLAWREYNYVLDGQGKLSALEEVPNSQLGLFRKYPGNSELEGAAQQATQSFIDSNDVVSISKSSTRSSVHRAVYPDYVVVKRFNAAGAAIGEVRILGLFTYNVYTLNTRSIPIVRQKVERILSKSKLLPQSHDGKNLRRVIETFPRDELFQADFETLFEAIMKVAVVNEKGAIRLLMRTDQFGKFVTCIAYVPRDSYSTKVRQKIESLIGSVIDSEELDSTTYFSESILARAYLVFRLKEGAQAKYDVPSLEESVYEIARGWDVRLAAALVENFGEREGQSLYHRYKNAFSLGYQEHFDPRQAVSDIKSMQLLDDETKIAMHFYQPAHAADRLMRFKVLHAQSSLELSEIVPILEHLGLRVLSEHPYELKKETSEMVWLHDFYLKFGLDCNLEVTTVAKLFESAFAAIWHGEADSDGFNRLVLSARLDWREVAMLRAYAAYMKQTTFAFSQDYIADTLVNQAEITRNLVALFKASFDPRVNAQNEASSARIARLQEKVLTALDEVENLNEDKILRRYLELIGATLRTNFYQVADTELHKDYISFKFSPKQLSDIPSPKPEFEVYVYSPRMEGVHLRGGKVARGGIRWSDRQQDYRTEVLGLVKAQQVKNAVIVPTGAKGGFICKRQYLFNDRDAVMKEGIACYKIFMNGLLDITDNIVDGEITAPQAVICKDSPDPYLVVAADKGTATFSDIANSVSNQYNHWLGDAFASGGSQGYDHKKMGITARGAWVSVQRHFRELGINIQEQPFTVVGIGDMAGDVFGNGMLLSEKIKLVAAFNHAHIFIDPNPDCDQSFMERKRLFEMPRSSWADYDSGLISEGGGVFPRSAKSISISTQMKQIFGIEADSLAPTELIKHLLLAPVDLIWNGGIGTYVKHSTQTHGDVGDKANDALRVDGKDLRCRVFGEGGNLGMTQLGRVEFALNGGACNTDFIDNAAGVDCSDHEVNIKILLKGITNSGDLTEKQRNLLLEQMTESVATLVLNNNYRQTQALSLAQFQAQSRIGEFKRFIRDLESKGRLDRALEFLPEEETLVEREKKGASFTRPELAVLLSYAKVELKEVLLKADMEAYDVLTEYVETAFPEEIVTRYKTELYQHPLLKEIVATQVANDLVNTLGITSAQRLAESTASDLSQVAVAFVVAKKIFRIDQFMEYIHSLDNETPAGVQYELLTNMARRVRRGTRWFLRNRRNEFNPRTEIEKFSSGIVQVNEAIESAISDEVKRNWQQRVDELNSYHISPDWLLQLAVPDYLYSGLSAVEVSNSLKVTPAQAGMALFALYEAFEFDWLAQRLSFMPVKNAWQAKARETYLDELDNQQRELVIKMFSRNDRIDKPEQIQEWLESQQVALDHWLKLVEEIKREDHLDFAMFSVLVGALVDCVNNRLA